ncbi:hypothetical protein [Leptospira interrogans]|uniref:hypothetical protein n=1 Tax=Leptospira interrogans TaxID=173 RepID=UPI000772F7D4|nr:hypothetical protein [Leptospira interrogans]
MNWNDQRLSKSKIEMALKSYEDKNSDSMTSHEDWKSAMRALEGQFDQVIGKVITDLHNEYKLKGN